MPGKVLLLETLGSDYGAYFLTRGFVDLLGAENVRMWPYKRTLAGGTDSYPERIVDRKALQARGGQAVYGPPFSGCELWADRALWRFWRVEKNLPGMPLPNDGPVRHVKPLAIPEASDEEIFAGVAAGEFSLVVLNGCRWHGSTALHELQATFGDRLPPVVVCDHDDYPQRRWDFTDAFRPAVYFKRSSLVGGHPHEFMFGRRDVPVRPMPFASMWDVPWVPWAEREHDIFCVFGATQVMRRRIKAAAVEVAAEFPGARVLAAIGHPMGHDEYLAALSRSKIVVDQQSFGTDTLRFWEAASTGCCLVSDFNLVTSSPQIIPGEHYLKFDNDLSAAGDRLDLGRFREVLAEALRDDAGAEARARRLYEAVRGHHTCADRARYVIREVQATGHALAGLP